MLNLPLNKKQPLREEAASFCTCLASCHGNWRTIWAYVTPHFLVAICCETYITVRWHEIHNYGSTPQSTPTVDKFTTENFHYFFITGNSRAGHFCEFYLPLFIYAFFFWGGGLVLVLKKGKLLLNEFKKKLPDWLKLG